MLSTIEQYIVDESLAAAPWWLRWYREDRRFARLLVFSAIGHLFFYGFLVRLDLLMKFSAERQRSGSTQLVLLAEVGAADRSPQIRTPLKSIDRVDRSKLAFDPSKSDDVNIVAKSPKRGNPRAMQAVPETEPARSGLATSPLRSLGTAQARPTPPQITAPVVSQITPPQSLGTGRVPVSGPTGPPPATPEPPLTTRTTRAEESRGTPEFSPTAVQAQYLAYVRAKISRTNERIMPRDWIRDVLRDKVSSEFVVQLRRDGEVQSAILTRSSGFAVLDAKAREAIYIARPFEGYPPNAGDTLTVTVTVFYAPIYR